MCELEEVEDFGTLMYFMVIDPATGEQDGNGIVLVLYSDGDLAWIDVDEEANAIYNCFIRVEETAAE